MQKNIGKFQILRVIDKGATSTVYLAEDPFTGQQVAIKVALQAAFSDPLNGEKFQKMFINEASLAGKLRHPHIVSVYDAGVEDDQHYIVMEYVPGHTLERYSTPNKLLPYDDVIEIMFKCCSALDYAARHGVIHRDIKPANLLIVEGTDVKISDFGTALMENADHTQIVEPVGSPAYMSPEQIRGEKLTHQTDIYSLGVVMYRLLTGRLPFAGKSQPELLRKILQEEPPSLYTLRSDIPQPMVMIVEKCLQKNPAERYLTWAELERELALAHNQLEVRSSEDVSDTEKFNTLRKLDFFHECTDVELWEVVRISQWRRFSPDTALLTEGKIGGSLFVLATGTARIMIADTCLGNIDTGQCFGEMAYIHGKRRPRSASVISNDDVTVIKFKSEVLQEASIQLQTSINKQLLRIMADRLEKTSIMAAVI
jgi:serine/threonine protein kinase